MADALMADALMASATLTNPSPFLTYSPPRLPSKIVLGFPLIITVRLVLMGYFLEGLVGLVFSVITVKYAIINLKLKCKVELLSFNTLKMQLNASCVEITKLENDNYTATSKPGKCSGNAGNSPINFDILLTSITNTIEQKKENTININDVKNYIQTFSTDIEYFTKLNIIKENKDQYINAMLKLYYPPWAEFTKDDIFNTNNEDNQLSVLLQVYKVIQNKHTKIKDFDLLKKTLEKGLLYNATNEDIQSTEITNLLTDIHDGWALARLITATMNDNTFNNIQYKTKNDNILNEAIELNTTNSTHQLFLNAVINKKNKNLDKLLKNIHIKINSGINGTSIIRADQLAMMVPFNNLLDADKLNDIPFLKNFLDVDSFTYNTSKKLENVNKAEYSFQIINKLFPNIQLAGGHKSKKSIKYIRTDYKYGKNIVYTTSRGGKYIKNKNGDYEKITMKKH